MKRAPVLSSLLETDLYKLTMWQALLHRHPATQAEYRFVCRNPQAAAFPLAELRAEVEAELDHLCALSFTAAELDWLVHSTAGMTALAENYVGLAFED